MKSKPSFLKNLRKHFGKSHETITIKPGDKVRLSGKGVRVASRETPFSIEMGKQVVHVCPDRPACQRLKEPPFDFVLFDPELCAMGIAHCLRIKPGETLSIDHRQEHQKLVFSRPKHAFRRHLQITHEGDAFVFSDPISELGTYLSVLSDEQASSLLERRRASSISRTREIFGGPLAQLSPDSALHTLREANQCVRDEPFRRLDSLGNAGSVVELPAHLTPIIVGDLHGQVDNLLKILSENAFMESLDRGVAALVLLGDAVHPESDGRLEDMESSILIMDLIFKLKVAFPDQLFFIMGNHDSFSPDVMKGGVAQSLVWEKRLSELRGKEYCEELALFYRQSPLVVLSQDFVACHAGPPCSSVSMETLIEARQFPELMHQLTWNRIKTKGWPLGYRRGDVKRFRKSLGLDESIPFIVAHFPQSRDETLWLNVDQIPNHHILFSAREDRVAVFTRINGEMIPQIYPAEPLLEILTEPVSEEP